MVPDHVIHALFNLQEDMDARRNQLMKDMAQLRLQVSLLIALLI